MNISISKRFTFEASHVLPKHPGKCSRLHGHSWVLTVTVMGPIDPETGLVMDFGELKDVVQRMIIDKVDHQHLGVGNAFISNGVGGLAVKYFAVLDDNFYPTSENLVQQFATMLVSAFTPPVRLHRIRLEETCTSAAELCLEEL